VSLLDEVEMILRLLLAQLKAARDCPVHGNAHLEIAFDIRCGACAHDSGERAAPMPPQHLPVGRKAG